MSLKSKGFFLTLLMAATLVSFTSCSKYSRILKSQNMQEKYEAAKKYYNKKDYVRASPLFDELLVYYSGSREAETIYYYYAYTKFGLGELSNASYHFRNFYDTYTSSPYAEECLYMHAYCNYLETFAYYLDQSFSERAIQDLQLFINLYPQSKYLNDCNNYIDNLRQRLQKKSYETALLYYRISDYRAAIVMLKNTLKDFPEVDQREEIEFLIVKASYKLAVNSVEDKKEQRLKDVLKEYEGFREAYPASAYLDEAEEYYIKTQEQLKTYQ